MKKTRNLLGLLLVLAASLLTYAGNPALPGAHLLAQAPAVQPELKIRFSFTEQVSRTPVNGRIIIGFTSDLSKSIDVPNPFDPQPSFAWEVRDWKPGEAIVLDGSQAVSWKGDLEALDGWYVVQAVLKTNRKARSVEAVGNAVTNKNVVFIEKGRMCRPLDLLFNIPWRESRQFKETEFVKEVNFQSDLLTRFYGEPEFIQAGVILPRSYFQEKDRRYPSVYVMGGWGLTHFGASTDFQQKRYGMTGFGREKIFIFINGECRSGYYVFCDSEINGPREETFFRELIPFIEKEYRVDKDPRTRFLMGQSTGAWASLWLLVRRPEEFGGAYAGSPDPVDFTEFCGTNIYEPKANMYFNSRGEPIYLNDLNGAGSSNNPGAGLTFEDFVGIDRILGWGEQVYSWDATFSPCDGTGEPRHLFDWVTGRVDPEIAIAWKSHDLSLVVSGLDQGKKELLRGKIHIFVAEDDDFGLNKPVKAFQKVLAEQGIDADIRFLPSGGHVTWSDEQRKEIHGDIDRKCESAARAK